MRKSLTRRNRKHCTAKVMDVIEVEAAICGALRPTLTSQDPNTVSWGDARTTLGTKTPNSASWEYVRTATSTKAPNTASGEYVRTTSRMKPPNTASGGLRTLSVNAFEALPTGSGRRGARRLRHLEWLLCKGTTQRQVRHIVQVQVRLLRNGCRHRALDRMMR
eukprot:4657440-Amphidinium_carterae.1